MTDDIVRIFSNKLRDFSNNPMPKIILMEMKSLIMNSEKQVLVAIAHNCELNYIFDCLYSSDEEQIEMSCTIIYNLLKNLNSKDFLVNYNKFVERALSHPSSQVKCIHLKLLNEMIDGANIKNISDKYPELLIQASDCIENTERSVAEGAIMLFKNIGMSHDGIEVLFSTMMLEKFKKVMALNDIARFRIYEIVSYVSVKSEEGLKTSHKSNILKSLLDEIKSSDTLLQLNALEILSSFGSVPHGYRYLQESGVIQYLIDKILRIELEPLAFVLLPGLIEFFGNICKIDPQQFIHQYPDVMNLMFSSLETSDEVILGVIYSTVGKIGSSTNGKFALSQQKDQIKIFLKKAGELLVHKNDTAVSIMHSLTELFTISNESNELNAVLLSWFEQLGPCALDTIVNCTKFPFIELRFSALTFLNAIAKLPWGCEKLCHYPGMIEYLTDRSTEFNKDCKSAKYDIICSIVNMPDVSVFLNNDNLNKLKDFIKEGPYFVPTMPPEMITEGAS